MSLRDIDYEVLREPWNKYSLADGAYLKANISSEPFSEVSKLIKGVYK
jgi:hypothetical protein